MLAYLSRYTHRVALSNRRLIAFDEAGVTFRYRDYRRTGPERRRIHDARYPRVHAPLPSACPATRLPPHPALRTACQHDTQGQCRSRPRTPKCIASSGTWRPVEHRRSSPAMSLLRRAHAYHRHFRTLEPTTCAASSVHANRDDAVVTRHGLPPSPTAAPSLRSPTRCACCTPDRAIRTHSDRRRSVLRSQPQIIRPSRSSPDASSRRPIALRHAPKPQIPIARPGARGFVLRGLSYAYRRPKLFTEADCPLLLARYAEADNTAKSESPKRTSLAIISGDPRAWPT